MLTTLKNIAMTVVVMALGCLVLDFWLQATEIQSPLETRLDADIGPTYVADRQFSRYGESFFLGATNEWGCLGEGRPPRAENGERRILLVGDSYVLGHTVFERHHFARVIEEQLRAAGQPATVLNFARADFNLWNMHRYYRDFAGTWDHDLAFLFVDRGDIRPASQTGADLYPVSVVEGDSVVGDYSFRNSPRFTMARRLEPVLNNFALPRMAFNAYKLLQRGEGPEMVLGKLAPRSPDGVSVGWPARPVPANSTAILADLAADPRVVMVFKDDFPDAYASVIDSLGVTRVDLREAFYDCEAKGINPRVWPVTGQRGHWNHAAHRAIGALLSAEILERDLLAGN